MSEADTHTQPSDDGSGSAPTAGAGEPTIPKHRFDQVLRELRDQREANAIKDRVLAQFGQRPAAQPQEPKAEDYGMEPETFKAVSAIAKKIAGDMVAERDKVLRPLIGHAANTAQEAAFLGKYGQDKVKYLDEVRSTQEAYQRETGGYMPIERAFQLVHYRELVAREAARTRGVQAGAPAPQATYGQPAPQMDPILAGAGQAGSNLTHSVPRSTAAPGTAAGGGARPASKNFDEANVEEMEALLEGGFREGRIV